MLLFNENAILSDIKRASDLECGLQSWQDFSNYEPKVSSAVEPVKSVKLNTTNDESGHEIN